MPVFDISQRTRSQEWMDGPDVARDELERSLRFIRRINALLGYTRATLGHLRAFSKRWSPGETIRILDVATGSADIPRAILAWAGRAGFDVRVTGVDLHPLTAELAAHSSGSSPGSASQAISIVRASALELPFADASFDYVMTAMFLHHLDDADAILALREMNRVARRGIIAADLVRNRRAYAWISLFTLASNPMVRHDARVSVAQAFTRREALALRDSAGLNYARYVRHFGHRFALAGEKR